MNSDFFSVAASNQAHKHGNLLNWCHSVSMDNSITHYLLCLLVQVKNGKKSICWCFDTLDCGNKIWTIKYADCFSVFFPLFFAGKDETVRYKWKLNVWQTPFAAPADKELNMFFSFSVISFGIIYRLYELLLYLICPFFPHLISSESILMLTQGDSQQRFLRELYSRDKCEYNIFFTFSWWEEQWDCYLV